MSPFFAGRLLYLSIKQANKIAKLRNCQSFDTLWLNFARITGWVNPTSLEWIVGFVLISWATFGYLLSTGKHKSTKQIANFWREKNWLNFQCCYKWTQNFDCCSQDMVSISSSKTNKEVFDIGIFVKQRQRNNMI